MQKILIIMMFTIVSLNAVAQIDKSPMPKVSQTDGVAINGYDPVAFFKENKAIQGSNVYTCQWNDATWYFSSQENRDLFLQNPKDYAPQYGGYCAHAIASGKLVESDPQSFHIENNKLYLYRDEKSKRKASFNFSKTTKKANKNWLKFTSRF